MRTASWSDAPTAIEQRDEQRAARSRSRRSARGHEISAFSAAAPAEIAAATTTPHATHCSRARSCSVPRPAAPADVSDEPDERGDRRRDRERRDRHVGSLRVDRGGERHSAHVSGDRDAAPPRCSAALPCGSPSARCRPIATSRARLDREHGRLGVVRTGMRPSCAAASAATAPTTAPPTMIHASGSSRSVQRDEHCRGAPRERRGRTRGTRPGPSRDAGGLRRRDRGAADASAPTTATPTRAPRPRRARPNLATQAGDLQRLHVGFELGGHIHAAPTFDPPSPCGSAHCPVKDPAGCS